MDAYRATRGVAYDVNERLLDFFLIEKAAYEIVYEAANRPTWLAVPLAGLALLAERVLGGEREDGHGGA